MSLYHLIRLVLAVAIAAIPFLLLRRTLQSKARIIISLVCLVVVNVALCHLPFENAFVSFATPEEAARYAYEKGICIVEGEESGLLLLEADEAERRVQILPKEDGKWKLSGEGGTNFRGVYADDTTTIVLIQYKKTTEYYIYVHCDAPSISISDSLDSDFWGYENDLVSEYYAYIPQFDDTYTVTIDGTTIALTEDSPHLVKGLFS